YLRTFEAGKLGPRIPGAATPRVEAHAAGAVHAARRVLVAWDEGGANSGQGTRVPADPRRGGPPLHALGGRTAKAASPGTVLYDSRKVSLVVFDGERRQSPAADLGAALAEAGITSHDYPQLYADPRSGRVALAFHRWGADGEFTAGLETRQIGFWGQAGGLFPGNRAS